MRLKCKEDLLRSQYKRHPVLSVIQELSSGRFWLPPVVIYLIHIKSNAARTYEYYPYHKECYVNIDKTQKNMNVTAAQQHLKLAMLVPQPVKKVTLLF